jgi:hypothetical protein
MPHLELQDEDDDENTQVFHTDDEDAQQPDGES